MTEQDRIAKVIDIATQLAVADIRGGSQDFLSELDEEQRKGISRAAVDMAQEIVAQAEKTPASALVDHLQTVRPL